LEKDTAMQIHRSIFCNLDNEKAKQLFAMKSIKKISGYFFPLLLIVSCTNIERYEVEKNDFPKTLLLNLGNVITDSMNLSDIADRVEYIPLQTTDSALLGYFLNFVITKDNFFIKNESSVLTYDNHGKYLNNLFTVGNGPGEAYAYCLTVDESKKQVYVYDRRVNNVKIYSYNGTYINTIKKAIKPIGYTIYSIGFFKNSLFIHTTQRQFIKYLYSILDLQTDSIRILCKNYRVYDKSQEAKNSMAPYDYHYQITDSNIMYKESFCDTIFEVKKDLSQTPRYIIGLGSQKLDWKHWRDEGMFNFTGSQPSGYQVQSFIETKRFLLIVLKSIKEPQMFVVFNKLKNSTKIFKNKIWSRPSSPIYLKNDLDNIVPFPPMNQIGYLFYYRECLYGIIEAKDFANAYKTASSDYKKETGYLRSMAPVFSTINEFSNPIVMKVYLK
jgi:hypothetical protein